ncbi:alpha/beta fold hydrolase [Pseudolysobacter antarcticus]|uniref:Alpha/beta fold hydrolase n=1 Tax=Pseudolysobacter antarcticus TaxID=2511995 RepID=A0A411HGN0_9GAMM|nr:alpha/beta hydrolase [Pseudolysobacter antarcticus]QBB69686.1 alpha/beta fold hydrolase [Pseudolysobacter antarcticus]
MHKEKHDRRAICVHGAGGGGWEWTIWQRVFAAHGWKVQAPDLQPAPAGIAATQLDDYTAQVAAWTASQSTIPAVLIGASLGGLLALQIASRVPVAALVLVNPLPPAPLQMSIEKSAYPRIVAWGKARSLAGTRRAMPDADDAACVYAFRRWSDESGSVLNAALRGVDVTLPTCPILLLASELDDDVPLATSIALASWLNADLICLPQASHVGPLLGIAAADCAERVLQWLHEAKYNPARAVRKSL